MTADLAGDERAFRPLLGPGERVLWSGRPLPGLRFSGGDVAPVLAGAATTAFALFWTGMAISIPRQGGGDTPSFFAYLFPLFGLIFVASGLYQLLGRFFYEAWRRSRTYYAITTARVLILERSWGERVRERHIAAIEDSMIRRRRDGSGSILLDPPASFGFQAARGWPKAPRPFAIEHVAGIDRVVEIVRRQQAALS